MRRPRRARARRWRVVAAALVVAAGIGLAGCTSVRNDLGTGSSGCFVALPAASAAVHHRGKLDGVRLVAASTLSARAPDLYDAARAGRQRDVCLVAFTGHFATGDVRDPMGQAAGDLAVVELGYPDHRLLGTLLVTRQPLPFGHSHIAPL